MKAKTYTMLSQACLVAGGLSIVGSLATWISGRMVNNQDRENDGLFIGLWAPTFFILSDRFSIAALEEESLAGEAVLLEEVEVGPVQSPHPLSHVNR